MLDGPEVLFNLVDNRWQRVLEKVDDSLEVEFCTQNVEKYILAITLVEFADLVRKLIEHRKVLT